MKPSSVAILILVILCLALSLVIAIKLPCKCDEPASSDNVLSFRIQLENDSLLKSNRALDRQINQYRLQSDSLRQKISDTKQSIEKLKLQQYEKITRMDSLTSTELYGFFSKFNP